MSKKLQVTLRDEEAQKVQAILDAKGMTFAQVVRKMFKLEEAAVIPWQPWAHRKVCQPGADTLATGQSEDADSDRIL